MITLVCDGTVTETVDGYPMCSTGWMTQPSVAPFELSQIDPEVATAMFTAGFMLAIVPWATAWGFKQLLRLLR